MPYTITRENPERDLEALKAILDNDGIVDSDVQVLEQIADAIKEQLPKRDEREQRLSALVRSNAKRYSHREVSASSLHTAFQDFADRALEIFEVPR